MNYRVRMQRIVVLLLVLVQLPISINSISAADAVKKKERPEKWAIPVIKHGLPNFYKVSDNLYRGAQPMREGFEQLRKMGIRTIINLRENYSDRELISGLGFNYINIPVDTMKPKKADFERFIKIVNDPGNHPAFVHCREGADRTGAAVALYRIKTQSWNTDDAIAEMRKGGFGHHKIFNHLIVFIRNFDE